MQQWVIDEVGSAQFKDQRLSNRLLQITNTVLSSPGMSLAKSHSNAAQLKGAYRFFSHDAISPEAILAPHMQNTVGRLAETEGFALAIHDTSEFVYTKQSSIKGLCELNHNQPYVNGLPGFQRPLFIKNQPLAIKKGPFLKRKALDG